MPGVSWRSIGRACEELKPAEAFIVIEEDVKTLGNSDKKEMRSNVEDSYS
jgi:hypothetical protein